MNFGFKQMKNIDIFTLTDNQLVRYCAVVYNKTIKQLMNEIHQDYSYSQYAKSDEFLPWPVRQKLRIKLSAKQKELNIAVMTAKQIKFLILAGILTGIVWVIL